MIIIIRTLETIKSRIGGAIVTYQTIAHFYKLETQKFEERLLGKSTIKIHLHLHQTARLQFYLQNNVKIRSEKTRKVQIHHGTHK